jgi:hypothetical protein
MGGKAALLLVLGFSLIFLVFGHNFSNLTIRAVDNISEYYEETNVYNIAASGANIAASEIFRNPGWNANGFHNIQYSGGELDISVEILDADQNIRRVTSVGSMVVGDSTITKIIQVTLQPASFSMYAYFCQIEGNIWWTAGDSVWGPFHTQDWMQVQGHPYFYGKATTKKGLKYYNSKESDHPDFVAGYQENISLDLPDDKVKDFEALADAGGAKFTPVTTTTTHSWRDYWGNWHTTTSTSTERNFYLTFKEDSLTYKVGSSGAETTVYLPDFAPNGIIYAKEGNLRVKGVVKGQYTIVADGASSGRGQVYLEDDIVYSENPYSDEPHGPHDLPKPNPNCHDILGIVARNEVLIADNANNNNDINIHASIYSEKEGFGAENHTGRGFDGDINLVGGIIQKKRQAVGTFSTDWWGNITSQTGFNKKYKYDSRLMYLTPPEFPSTDTYRIVSWYE